MKKLIVRLIEDHASFCLLILQALTWPIIAMLAWEEWFK